jgi:hypothetical protein
LLLVAAEAGAATVVLTGGKRLDVASYTVGGSYVVVRYANGRNESYPLSVVDLQATRDAAGTQATPAAEQPAEPHSPFFGAKAAAGKGGVLVTDADVKHIESADEEATPVEDKKGGETQQGGGQVSLVSYERRKVAEGQWDITATVANVGSTAVSSIGALMRVLDEQGKPVTTGSGTFAGKLEPGKQATITARVALASEPFQVAFDLTWREVRPTPKPGATPAPGAAGTPQTPASASSASSAPTPSGPNTMPPNVMAPVSPNRVGAPAQVPRPGSPG